jgi:hypothetical protein
MRLLLCRKAFLLRTLPGYDDDDVMRLLLLLMSSGRIAERTDRQTDVSGTIVRVESSESSRLSILP